jgi:hypothetical protein
LFGATLVAAGLGWACDVYDPSLLQQGDGGTDAGDAGGAGEVCELTRPPARSPADAEGEDAGEVLYALRDVVIDQQSGRWETIGFDLDGICSEPPDPKVSCKPPASGASGEVDGVGGIDNSVGHNVFPLVQLAIPDLQDVARENQAAGIGAVLLRIRGWNGEDNDPRVDVTVTQSALGTASEDGSRPELVIDGTDATLPDGGQPPPPAWMGDDYWWARSETFVGGNAERPRVRDDTAYVAKGRLVVALPERVDIIFAAQQQGVLVRLTDARLTADFSDDRRRLERVIVAGRWSVNDLLDTAEAVGVCQGSEIYDLVFGQLMRSADVRSRPGTGGPNVECNAVSVGVEFSGYRGHFGGIMDAPELPNACELKMDDGGVGTPSDAGTVEGGSSGASLDGGLP